MKEVVITVKADGSVEVEAFGFKGPACEKAIDMLIDGLGQTKDKKKKPEFFQQQVRQQQAGR